MGWMSVSKAAAKLPRALLAGEFEFDFDRMPVCLHNLSGRQRRNLAACGGHALLKSLSSVGLPPIVQIEPLNICNLSCPLCPTGTGVMKRPRGLMTRATFDRIMGDLEDVLLCAVLYCWGEPLLHPDLPAMIRRCTDKNIASVTSTNGNSLRGLDHALALVDSGLTHLVIAVDGSSEAVYQSYRKQGRLSLVVSCLQDIERAKALRGSKHPYTNLRLVFMQSNAEDLPNVEQLARDCGVNMFSWKSVGCLAGGPGGKPPAAFSCPYPWRQPTVFWDGTVVACEFDYDSDNPLGNINEKSFPDLWSGPEIRALRRNFRRRKPRPGFCSRCPYGGRSTGTVLGWKELRDR